MTSTLVLLNPMARKGTIAARWSEYEPQLREALAASTGGRAAGLGAELRVVRTTRHDFGAGIVRTALDEGVRRVVVVGGDGTLSEAVQGFWEHSCGAAAKASELPSLGILPAGRGDDFFKMLTSQAGLSGRSREACWAEGLRILQEGRPCPTDLGRVTFVSPSAPKERVFINLASFGYPGLVVQRVAERRGWLGRSWLSKTGLTYIVQSALALGEYRPVRMRITVDGHPFYEGPVFSAFVLNGAYNAGGACWSKDARIDDGLFHVTVVEPRSFLATAQGAPRMWSGDWAGARGVHLASGRAVEVTLENPGSCPHRLCEVDGDLAEPHGMTGMRFEVLPAALSVWRA